MESSINRISNIPRDDLANIWKMMTAEELDNLIFNNNKIQEII